MHRIILEVSKEESQPSFAFIISSTGETRIVGGILSSMPKSDLIAMQLDIPDDSNSRRLRSLPISPFPVRSGGALLTHLFSAPAPPTVTRSSSRLPKGVREMRDKEVEATELPIKWLEGRAWRRWGSGVMLGYRSYTGVEVEVIHQTTMPKIC